MNANEVLANVNRLIEEGEKFKKRFGCSAKYRIKDSYKSLGIFDWWNETLSVSQLKQMKKFLETAISLGYTGYVCFKVGAKYCSHGMWAHRLESEDGYSPKTGGCLFHSFVSGANYWDIQFKNGEWAHERDEQYEFTLKEIKYLVLEDEQHGN